LDQEYKLKQRFRNILTVFFAF